MDPISAQHFPSTAHPHEATPGMARFLGPDRRADRSTGRGQVSDLLHSATETLILLGVIVLEADLELDRLAEVALLVLGALQHAVDALVQGVPRHLAVGAEEERRLGAPETREGPAHGPGSVLKVVRHQHPKLIHAIMCPTCCAQQATLNAKIAAFHLYMTIYKHMDSQHTLVSQRKRGPGREFKEKPARRTSTWCSLSGLHEEKGRRARRTERSGRRRHVRVQKVSVLGEKYSLSKLLFA